MHLLNPPRGKKTKKGSGEVVETGERRIGEGLEEE
jgi:hypothetical protein